MKKKIIGKPAMSAVFLCLLLSTSGLAPAAPSAPVITSPGTASDTGSVVSNLTPTFKWSAVSGATKYTLTISKAPYGSSNIVYQNNNLTGTSLSLPSGYLVNGNKYRWNMTAANSSGESSNSNTLYFQAPAGGTSPPSAPTINSPGTSSDTGFTVSNLTPTFTWNAVIGAAKYGLTISKEPYGSSNVIYQNNNLTGTSLSLPSGVLVNGIKYRWNLVAFNSGGESPNSNTLYFKTPSGTSPDTINPVITSFNVSPANVTQGDTVTISFTVSDSGGSGLKEAKFFRAPGSGSTPPSGPWEQIGSPRNLGAYGDGPRTDTFTDNTAPVGSFWYGVTVWDNAGREGELENTGLQAKKVIVSASPSPPQGGLPSRDLNLNNPDSPYGLIDLDPGLKPAGSLAYCKWGNKMPGGLINPGGSFQFSFNKLTRGPFLNEAYSGNSPELFLLKKSPDYTRVQFPIMAIWNPSGGDLQAGTVSFSSGSADSTTILLRKLHFRNELTDAKVDQPINSVQSDLKKAVILVHGWNPSSDDNAYDSGQFSVLKNALKSKMQSSADWRLICYRWENDADTGTGPLSDSVEAAEIGRQHGQHLGDLLDKICPNLEKVHFIAHSAGTWVAQGAARYIFEKRLSTKVQVTLLDPYMAKITNSQSKLGVEVINALDNLPQNVSQIFLLENYFSQDQADLDNYWGGDGATMQVFQWSDRSGVQSIQQKVDWGETAGGWGFYNSHDGPIQFYADTVEYSLSSPALDRLQNPSFNLNTMGWRASMYYKEQHSQPSPNPTPAAPVLIEPGTPTDTGYTLSTLAPTCRWNAVAGADRYTLSISKEPYGTAYIVHQENSLSGTSHVVPAGKLASGTKYRWNMTTVSGGVESVNSGTLYFKTPSGSTPTPTPTPNPSPTPSNDAAIALSGNLAFGNVAVGSSAQRTLTITNTGSGTLNVTGISHSPGVFSGDFTGAIAPGSSRNVTITFTPISTQSYQGQLTVISNAASGNPAKDETGTGTGGGSTPNPTPGQIYTLNITTNNGSVIKSPDQAAYASGATVSLTAVPDSGHEFAGWSGDASGTQNPLSVTMNGNKAITANFSAIPQTSVGGTVVNWGSNYDGQLNIWPSSLDGVIAIAAGWAHTVALKSDGTVVTWGLNGSNVPDGLNGVAAIAAGLYHTVALKSDGTVVTWNSYGQTTVPAGLNDVVAIAAGWNHNLALKANGTVVAWGDNKYGQANVPGGLSDVAAISADGHHNMALKSDGTVVAWGYNAFGQTNVPAELSGVVAIDAGQIHSLALKSDGTVVTWGSKKYGLTDVPSGGVLAISAGGYHSVALKPNGTVVAWGENDRGQSAVPSGLGGVIAVAAGGEHTVVLRSSTPSAKPSKPSITMQPADQQVNAGQSAVFTIAVKGTPTPRNIRWQRSTDSGASWSYLGSDETYSGVAALTLTVNNTTTSMNGHRFRAIASSELGQPATSFSALLTVNPIPTPTPTGQAKISLSGSLDFGEVAVGSSKPLTLTIMNPGGAALNVTGISHSPGVFSGDFTGAIPPGDSRDVVITFAPLAAQPYPGQLTVVSDAMSGNATKEEAGTGTATPTPSPSPSPSPSPAPSPTPAPQAIVLFEDDFDDNILDTAKWIPIGTGTFEVEGEMRLVHGSSSHLESQPFSLVNREAITVTRKTFIHHNGTYENFGFELRSGSSRIFGIYYSKMGSSSANQAAQGIYLARQTGDPIYTGSTDTQGPIPGLWGQWFNETFIYEPDTGELRYYINDELKISYNVGVLPADSTSAYLTANTWGWHTANKHYFDDLVIAQKSSVPATPLQLQSAVSRKTHGSAGTFDIDLPLTGTVGVESRSPGAAGHTLVLTFDKELASAQEELAVEPGSGSLAETPVVSGTTLTLRIIDIPNASRCTVSIGNLKPADGSSLYSGSLTFGVLEGDVNGNRAVNVADAAVIRQKSGQPLDAGNFRSDINVNGAINVGDSARQRQRSGTFLP